MSGFSEGPWRAAEAEGNPGGWFIVADGVSPDDESSCELCIASVSSGLHETNANARLISAAPDMLEALRLAYGAMNHMGDVLNNMDAVTEEDEVATTPAFDAVRAAIAKATLTRKEDE